MSSKLSVESFINLKLLVIICKSYTDFLLFVYDSVTRLPPIHCLFEELQLHILLLMEICLILVDIESVFLFPDTKFLSQHALNNHLYAHPLRNRNRTQQKDVVNYPD